MNSTLCQQMDDRDYAMKKHDGTFGQRLCKGFSRILLWIGVSILLILAIPAGVLYLLMYGVWTLLDRLMDVIDQESGQ